MKELKKDDPEIIKKEKAALNLILRCLQNLTESQRYKLLKCACDFFGIRLNWD